jgi:hypothetical protein
MPWRRWPVSYASCALAPSHDAPGCTPPRSRASSTDSNAAAGQARDRDPSDRRALLVRALPDRNADLMRLYSGMSASINKLLSGYGDTELELIADFLRRTANAGQNAADELADD